jgi:hypothetical protein
MFLDVSEEEATVKFKSVMALARKQWYRPIDNLFHVISDEIKERRRAKREKKTAAPVAALLPAKNSKDFSQ